jgi:hypothetical protein
MAAPPPDINAVLQQLVAALQNAAQPPPVPPVPVIIPVMISPYEGGMLDLTSKVGQSLFQEGSKPLDAKFSGKPEELFVFIADLKCHTQECYWNSAAHGILTITVNGKDLNLLDNYGQLTAANVEAARVIHDAGANNRSR